MEWSEYEQRGKGNPYKDPCIKDSEDCDIIGIMETVENKALMRIYRKDLTMPSLLYVWMLYISFEKLPTTLLQFIFFLGGVLLLSSSLVFPIRWFSYYQKQRKAFNDIQFKYSELFDFLLTMKSVEDIKVHPLPKEVTDFYDALANFNKLLNLNPIEKNKRTDTNATT